MRAPLFNNNEFLDETSFNNAYGLVTDSLVDITGNLHTPGLINASALSFSYSGLTITIDAPLPFRALFSDGTLASANGTVDGESSSSATVDFSSLVPSTGSVTAYLVAVSGSVLQQPSVQPGPPVGHPDYNPSFSPYTAYAEVQDTLIFSATTTAPDNTDTLLICSTVLSAGQTTITTSSTSGQVRAGAILSRNGEVLAADLGSGAAASNVGTLGGSLVGTLPNPTLASTGATSGTYINPITITVDEDGRVSNIANVSNWNVPGNVTAGGTIVASGTATAAAATSSANLIPYGQAFQLLQPAASESITLGNTLKTLVITKITATATLTLEPGSVIGQEVIFYSGAYAVTVQSNVNSGNPVFNYPDNTNNYSWTIPAGQYSPSIILVWDGLNWRVRTFGQQVVAPATQNNAAVQFGQLLIGNRKAVFTANGTYTVPPSVTKIWVSGCAGGGGGGGTVGSSGNVGGGGGGGGGAGQSTIKQPISVTPGHSLSITIGAAGTAGAGGANTGANGANGTAGGNTVLTDSTSATTLLTLAGGGGGSGAGGQASTSAGLPSGGNGGGGGPGYPAGSYGSDGNYTGNGGDGASNPFGGGGGSGRAANGAGINGNASGDYGSGGGGGGGVYGPTAYAGGNGGAGAPGFFVIEW